MGKNVENAQTAPEWQILGPWSKFMETSTIHNNPIKNKTISSNFLEELVLNL